MDQKKEIDRDEFEIVGIQEDDTEKILRPSMTYWQDAWMRLKKNKSAIFGLIFIVIIVFLSIFAPMVSPYEYDEQQDLEYANLPPKVPILENTRLFDGVEEAYVNENGVEIPEEDEYEGYDNYHYFGTDDLGRDIWTRVWWGVRVSLLIASIAVFFDLIIGVLYGSISAYFGGKVDLIMQRIVEILAGIPYLIVVMLFLVIFENSSVFTIAIALSITGWIKMSRVVRAQVLKLKNQDFVLAARTLGTSHMGIIFKHLVPNMLDTIIITIMFTIPSAIFAEAFLSFIGLGIAPPMASLGTLIQDGMAYMLTQPYKLFFPAFILSVLILSFNFLADGLRDALDPKMRK